MKTCGEPILGVAEKAFLKSIPVGLTFISRDYRIMMVSPTQASLFKKSPAELVGRRCFEVFEKRGAVCPRCPGTRAMATGKAAEARTSGILPGGSRMPVVIRAFPVRDPEGRVAGFIEFVEDLSLLHKAEEEIGFRNSLLRTQADASPNGLLVVDSQGRMVSFNKRFVDMWGIPAKVAESRSDEAALDSVKDKLADPAGFLKKVRFLYRHPDKTSFDEVPLGDGRTFERHSAPLRGPGGHYYGRAWFFRDISRSKQSEAEKDLLLTVSRIFKGGAPVQQACQKVADELVSNLRIDVATILLSAQGGRWVKVLGTSAPAKSLRPGECLPADRTASSLVLKSGRDLVVRDCRSREGKAFRLPHRLGVRSLLCLPIRGKKGVIGTISVGTRAVRTDLDRLTETLRAVGAGIAAEMQRKRAEHSLSESEERYRRIVETSAEGISQMDRGLVITYANDRFCAMLGFGPQELVGRNIRELFFPEDWRAMLKRMADLRHGESGFYESRFRRKDGTGCWFQVSGTPVRDDRGRFAGGFAMFTDITARKKAEAELANSQQLYKALAQGIPDFVFLLDPSGRVQYSNRRPAHMPDPEGKSQEELFPPAVADKHLKVIRRVVRRGKPSLREETVSWGGRSSVLENRLIPLKGADGRVERVLGLSRDITRRKATEEALRQSEERYRSIIETTQEGYGAIDLRHTITGANSRLERMFGYSAGKMIGLHIIQDLTPPEDRPGMITQMRSRRKGRPAVYEQRFRRKDGSTFWANVSGTPVFDKDGAMTGSFAMLSDITERKLAQEAVRKNEERFRSIVEGLRDEHFFYQHDTRGVFTYLSPSIERVLGYTKSQFLTHYTHYLTGNPINKEVVRRTELSIKGVKQPPYLVEIFHKNRTRHWLRVIETPIRDSQGRVTGVEGLAQDITERMRAEDALRQSEERFRALFNLSRDVVFVHHGGADPRGRLVEVNDAAVRKLGYSREELLAMSPANIDDPESGADMPAAVASIKSTGHVLFEQVHIAKNGRRIPVEINARSFQMDGKPMVFSIIRDISERKKAQADLMAMRAKVEASQETERRRLARELHDGVGQILSGIKFSLQALPAEVARSPWDASRHIKKAAGLLDRAIGEIRRVSQNLMPSELEDLGLETALRGLCRGLRERSGVETVFRGPGPAATFGSKVDLALFRIAQEALNNTERHASASTASVELAARGGSVELRIQDDGRGSAGGHKAALRSKGMGINNITDRVKSLGGSMEFDSRPAKGTRLVVRIPLGNGRGKGS